jgi:hypothetical protein
MYEVGEADGQAYIAMELVEGRTLSGMLHGGPLTAEHVVHYGQERTIRKTRCRKPCESIRIRRRVI